jgi:RimJ/RimL family protein N-acetyltransferase
MSAPSPVSLVPLSVEWHIDALQQLYWATPGYWEMYNFSAVPAGQAEHDLRAAAETPGRTLFGMVRTTTDATDGGELIGLIDFRLHWPAEQIVYLGLVMVAEVYQRQGYGTQAWTLLCPWLAQQAKMQKARLGVEQFNPIALKFFESLGFSLTGESNRIKVGDKLVRLLYMELAL